MAYVYVVRLLLDSFSAISFTLMAVLCLRDHCRDRGGWYGPVYTATALVCAVRFVLRVAAGLLLFAYGRVPEPVATAGHLAMCLIPALLLHLLCRRERGHLPWPAAWQGLVLALYGAGAMLGMLRLADDWMLLAPAGAAACALLALSQRPLAGPLERAQRRWLLALCGALALIFVLRMTTSSIWLLLVIDALPLGFIFVITWYVERFTFFDVLMKRGAVAFLALALVSIYFFAIAPRMVPLRLSFLGWGLTLWPVMLAYPWMSERIAAWIDRRWLGRRFSPAEAARYFLAGLQRAATAEEAARVAEGLLAEIFQADGRVTVHATSDPEWMRAPVRISGTVVKWLEVRSPRFLSEDSQLLAALAGEYALLLEHLYLRHERLEREQELLLQANRAELKALRAQINPHFLFNTLNTIAGLIPRNPGRAEQTVEQLAEVFRYTLRRSDHEWVRLEEELDAVRAYMEIEQARFGPRLAYAIRSTAESGQVRIPAMMIQTLVENAVKHGVAAVKGQGIVEVDVHSDLAGLRVEVRDNGPGFSAGASATVRSGYGLRNIEERLKAHFGNSARLEIGSDEISGRTVVAIAVPIGVTV